MRNVVRTVVTDDADVGYDVVTTRQTGTVR